MTTIEKCKLAIEKGYKYDENTGEVFGVRGDLLKNKKNDYLCIKLTYKNKQYDLRSHQFAWYFKYNEVPPIIDHINRDKLDNRIVNLRSITSQQNSFNTNAKGYSYNKKSNKFQAAIRIAGKAIHIGCFNTPTEAEEAYKQAKKIHHTI